MIWRIIQYCLREINFFSFGNTARVWYFYHEVQKKKMTNKTIPLKHIMEKNFSHANKKKSEQRKY